MLRVVRLLMKPNEDAKFPLLTHKDVCKNPDLILVEKLRDIFFHEAGELVPKVVYDLKDWLLL